MEWEETQPTLWTQTVLLGLQRYYVLLRVRLHSVPYKTLLTLSSIQTLQLISFVFPISASAGLPWNYSFLSPFWLVFSVVFDPPALLRWLSVSEYIVVGCVLGLLAEQILTMLMLMYICARLSHYDFVTELSAPRMSIIHPWLFTTHEISNFLLLKALFFPLVHAFATDMTCIFAYTCLSWVQVSSVVLALETVALVVLIARKLTDIVLVGTIRWNSTDVESLSKCLFRGVLITLEIAMVLVTATVPYLSHPTVYLLSLIGLGAVYLSYLYDKLPFHQPIMNHSRVLRGLVFTWSSLICLLADLMGGFSQASFGPTALFFLSILLIFPTISSLYNTRNAHLSVIKKPEKSFEVEHMIRAVLRTATKQEENRLDRVISASLVAFPNSISLILWTVYYYVELKDAIFVKVSIAKLLGKQKDAISFVEAFYAVFYVENWFRSLPSERESIEYLNMRSRYRFIRDKDQEICEGLYEIFSNIGQSTCKFAGLVSGFHKIEKMITECKTNYSHSLKSRQCREFLDSYAGFLDILQREKKAQDLRSLSAELMKAQIKRKDAKVSLFDSQLMTVTMSLTRDNLGFVVAASGSMLLGYSDTELVGAHHSVLIPPPYNENHDRMLLRITRFRHKHPVFESLHLLYFMDRSRHLVPTDWKVSLINRPGSGELAILAAIRPHLSFEDIAFVSPQSHTITVTVTSTQTRGFQQFLQAAELTDPNVALGLSAVQDWNGTLTIYTHKAVPTMQESGVVFYVIPDVFSIFGLVSQLILRLVVSTDAKQVHRSSTSQFLQSVQPKRLIWEHNTTELISTTHALKTEASKSSTSSPSSKNAHTQHVRRLMKVKWYMKTGTALAVLLQIAVTVVLIYTMEMQIEQVDEGGKVVDLLMAAQIYTVKTALFTREMLLSETEELQANFTETSNMLKSLSEEIRIQLSRSPEIWSTALEETNTWWQYEQKGFKPYPKNLIDTLEALSTCTQSTNSQSLLSLYRNAHAETLKYQQRIFPVIVNNSYEVIAAQFDLTAGLIVICAVVIVAEVGLLLALVIVLERFRRKVWEFILTVPQVILSLSRATVANRLSIEFGVDTSDSAPHSGTNSSYRYERSTTEKALYIIFIVIVLSTVGFGASVIWSFSREIADTETEEYVKCIRRVTTPVLSVVYMRESLFAESLLPSVFAYTLTAPNATSLWQSLLSTFLAEETQFSSAISQDSTFSINFDSLSGPPSAQMGLHSALLELTLSQLSLSKTTHILNKASAASQVLELFNSLESALLSTLSSLNSEHTKEKSTRYRGIFVGVVVFSMGTLGLVAGVSSPLLLKFITMVRREWDLVLLFQDDDQGSLAVKLKSFGSDR